MGIQIKISGGTPVTGKALCHTCKHATVVRGQNLEEHIHCGAHIFTNTQGRVPFRVAECSQFHPVNIPWKHEMEDMAWIIEARRRGTVGFSDGGPMEVIVRRPNEQRNDLPE